MEQSQHVTYTQYSLLNSSELMNCNAEPASAPDTKSPRVFFFSHFRVNVAFAKSSLAFGAGDSHVSVLVKTGNGKNIMKVLRKIAVSVLVGLFLIGICYAQNTAMEIYLTGMEYAVKGDFKEAKEQFEKALKIDPFFRNAKECLEPIEDVINQKISNEMAIYIFKGVTYSNKDMFNKAIVECNQAIAIDPKYGSVYNDRGLVFLFKGEYDRAISDFNKIIEINPRYTIAYVNRGCVYEKKGQYDRALADYTKAIEIDPRNIEAYNNRGLIYGKYKSQFDNSIVEFTKAIEIDPRNAEVYENRAVSYYCKGEYDKAWEDVHKAQDLGHQVSPQLLRLLNDTSGLQK